MQVQLIGFTEVPEFLKTSEHPGERLCERAGRLCYRSTHEKGKTASFLQSRIQEGHESLIEHFSMTFEITGISRACSHQLVRHRIASYSQESQRYVDMARPEFVLPATIASDDESRAVWDDFMQHVTATYRHLRRLGIPKQDARFVLPNATATSIIVTMNARSLRHFFEVRLHKAAQWEIRWVALDMLALAYKEAPALFADIARFLPLDEGEG